MSTIVSPGAVAIVSFSGMRPASLPRKGGFAAIRPLTLTGHAADTLSAWAAAVELAREAGAEWVIAPAPGEAISGDAFELARLDLTRLDQRPDARLNRFAGRVTYRHRFVWDGRAAGEIRLDLGEVANGVTEVRLNGRPLGVRWYGRHHYETGGALLAGQNELEVVFVTTLFNALRSDKDPPEPSGMLGPVTLRSR